MKVRPDRGSNVTVSTGLPMDQCAVCTVSGVNDTQTSCHSSLSLVPEKEVTLLFKCSQPLDQAYTVIVTRTIECTKDTCSPTTVEIQPSILTEFARTFTWEFKAPEKTAVSVNILGDGLMETSQPCTNGFQFSVATSKANSKDQTRYCRGGSVTRLDLLNEAVMSLQVNPKAQVESVLFQVSAGPLKGRTMVITIDSSTTVVVSRDPVEPACDVCSVDGPTPNCSPTEKTLTNVEKLSLEFSCQNPQDMYRVKIRKKIECTTSSCTPSAGEADPNLFKDFNRSLIWHISVPEKTVLSLDFPDNGLKEISGAENCQDGYQYSVSTTKSDRNIRTNRYCKSGTVSDLDFLGATAVTVEVPRGGDLTAFGVRAAPRGGRTMSVTPDPNTIVIISRVTSVPDCSVCVNAPPNQKCNSKSLKITDPRSTLVEFTCPRPQDIFSVEINRQIDCTATSCSGNIVQAESTLFPDFNRTFTWDLKVVSTRTFQLDFPETGMQQIPKEKTCPNEHTYSVITYLRTGPGVIGTFCKGGPVTTILARYKGRVSLLVPANRKLDPVDFKLDVGPETSMLAIVKVNLPRGLSDTDFFIANYPDDFPDNQQMQWDFTVPVMHNYTMRFREQTAPVCLHNAVEVAYQKEDKKVTKLTLTDRQPEHQQGNFSMVLKNCETNKTHQGLTLKYTVSVMRSGHPVLCTVDLTKWQGVSLQIQKVVSDPFCEMSINSKVSEKINVSAGTKASLSFLDCRNEEVQLTASEVIGCQNVASCSMTLLTVPQLDSCLPMSLSSFTWHFSVPEDITVDLMSPTGSFQQSLPGQECNQDVSLNVAEEDGVSLGDFCFNGIIQKVQVHTNVSVTATARDFSKTSGPFLNASFSQHITETIIYTVSPMEASPNLLATPSWPQGMRPLTTVSWIVSLPSQYQAEIQFVNVSQPKCGEYHTDISVKMLGSGEEMISRREDEQMVDKLVVPQSFYLNMSNCLPDEGQFGVVTKVVLQKTFIPLPMILGILGAILLLLIVLGVVCFIRRKKKQKMSKESMFISKGDIFRPSDRHFIKTQSDNDSHIYTSVDETMVYSHLLVDSGYTDGMQDLNRGIQVDSYQTFTGPTKLPAVDETNAEPEMDQYRMFLDPSDTFIPSRPRTPIERQDSLGFQDSRMVDNELYTFKSTGEINTIQLSSFNLEPQPPITEESL
nr:CUB domain-containing protein 1-like isoform X2 [Monopterus albus]